MNLKTTIAKLEYYLTLERKRRQAEELRSRRLQSRLSKILNQRLSDDDILTGLPGPTYLKHALEHNLKRSIRSHQGLALLTITYKQITLPNDNLIIQKAAFRLQNHLRSSDIITRYYPNSFQIILTDLGCRSNKGYSSWYTTIHGKAHGVLSRLANLLNIPGSTKRHQPIPSISFRLDILYPEPPHTLLSPYT